MSVAHDAKGRVLILDQVNGRVVKRGADGSVEATFPEKLRDAQDMAVGADGHVALLDRLGDKSIALFDDNGNPSGELSLDGFGDTGIITGVQIDGNDVYVEREHGPLVKIGDTSGHMATPQTEIPGRPSRDGLSFLNAGITDQAAGRVWVSSIIRETGEHRFTRELRMRAEVHSIVLLDSDKKGTIYFAAALHEEPSADWVLLECLDPLNGSPIGSAVLPPNLMPEETFRDLVVLDEGGVIYAVRSEEGVSYEHYDCE